uniref:Uncharacterized protein n=1 Tax=Rhizophora mucronata TaxID=61149 RepID=A0A2P2MC14_RHIMU
MAAAFSVVQSTFFYRTSHFLAGNGRRRRRKDGLVHFTLSSPFFSSSAYPLPSNRNWRQPAVSLLELGGVKISKEGFFLACSFFFLLLVLVSPVFHNSVSLELGSIFVC